MTKKIEQRKIQYGSKVLELNVDTDSLTASIRFGTNQNLFTRRKCHETTIAFQMAETEIRNVISALGQPITLNFDTANTNLKTWALANQEALGFEIEKSPGEDPFRLTITKRYKE